MGRFIWPNLRPHERGGFSATSYLQVPMARLTVPSQPGRRGSLETYTCSQCL